MELTEEEIRIRKAQSEGGRKGGSKKNKNKGFGSDPDRAREAGKKGKETRYGKAEATSK